MTGNILGESLGEIFDKQISDRQKLHAAGYNNVKRNPQALNYFNFSNSVFFVRIRILSKIKKTNFIPFSFNNPRNA